MTRLILVFLLVAAPVTLAAFSAQASKTTAAPFSRPIHIIHGHLPPSTATRSHGRHHVVAPPSGSKKHAPYVAAPSPTYQEYALPPEPYAGLYDCLESVTEECGLQIYKGIFDKGAVSARCCGQLVGLGQRCHNGIVEATLALPELEKADKKAIKARDHKIWSQCVFITNHNKGGNSRLPISP